MANRSKKIVMSARVAPYIKAAIDTYANSKNEKFVKLLERYITFGLRDELIDNPFTNGKGPKISFMLAFECVWTEDELIYALRAGACGPDFAGEELHKRWLLLCLSPEFDGEFDLFGDVRERLAKHGFEPPIDHFLNMDRVRKEWPEFCRYVEFLENNKPFQPTYKEWREIASRSSEG